MVWWLQLYDRQGCSIQCRKEASWELLFDKGTIKFDSTNTWALPCIILFFFYCCTTVAEVLHLINGQIWSFAMKAPCCKHEIVIQTDPQNCEYVITSGAQKKVEEYEAEDAETMEFAPEEGLFLSLFDKFAFSLLIL